MDTTQIQCLGFIMDGNRRWATEQGLPTLEGHQRGAAVMEDVIHWVDAAGIPHVVFYAFSTENWLRSKAEVSYLMDLFREWLDKLDQKVKVKVVGNRRDFAPDIIEKITLLEAKSATHTDASTTVWIALSYGGRAEIIEAVNHAIEKGQPVDERSFESMLWTGDMPDPDMIVRTGGECRLSNFLTWKSVYSELYFMDTHWPALTAAHFQDILDEYARCNRRKGK